MKKIITRVILITLLSALLLLMAGIWGKDKFINVQSTGLLVAGISGTVLILFSLSYSLRKRYWHWGKMKNWLKFHELTALGGTFIIMAHTGLREFNLTGWVDMFLLLVLCGSGVIGRYLHMELSKELALRKKAAEAPEVLEQLQWWRKRFQAWRHLHIPLTHIFIIVLMVHIVGTAFYGGW